MSDLPEVSVGLTAGGVTAERVGLPLPHAQVAATQGAGHNTVKASLVPFACWRADDLRFDFESSLVRPEIAGEMASLKDIVDRHTVTDGNGKTQHRPALSVFGHADPTGDDEFNKQLSGRRAQAIYAMITRRVDLWEELFQTPLGKDDWKRSGLKLMAVTVSRPEPSSADKPSRLVLFRAYMDRLCTSLDADGLPVRDAFGSPVQLLVDKSDFLAEGLDPGGKGDFQGCSEFNPISVFSAQEAREFSDPKAKPKRDAENAPNRRVVIYLFRPGLRIAPGVWPCPRAKETTGACRKRFWSDGEERRNRRLPGERREFLETKDTFACRFYDRLSNASPCEQVRAGGGIFFMQCLSGDGASVLAKRKYRIRGTGDPSVRFSGVLDETGVLRHELVPAGDYVLSVQSCGSESAISVLRSDERSNQVCFLENGRLAIHVLTPEGAPIRDARVVVDTLGTRQTDEDGVAFFAVVDEGEFPFRVSKVDHSPVERLETTRFSFGERVSDVPIAAGDDSFATGRAKVKDNRVDVVVNLKAKPAPPAVTVKQIKGTLLGTRSTRGTPPRTPGDNRLTPSTSASPTPIDHVVLVRHKAQVVLEAITDPADQPVTWTVVPNQSAGTVPPFVLEEGDRKLRFDTISTGSFSAIATAKGGSSIRWNFVLVSVAVNVATAKTSKNDTFEDAFKRLASRPNPQGFNVPDTHVAAICGDFAFGKHAWSSELEIKLVGGGPKGDVGIDRVTPRYLQNVVFSNVVGEYERGGVGHSALNAVAGRILDVGGMSEPGVPGPTIGFVRDPASGQLLPQWPVTTAPGMIEVTNPNPADKSSFLVRMGDSPASAAFEKRIRHPDGKLLQLQRIGGFIKFAAAVASWSTDAPNTIAVHATHEWLIGYFGTVAFPSGPSGRGVYTPAGASVNPNVIPWALVDPPRGGLDARESPMEIFGEIATTISNNAGKPQANTF